MNESTRSASATGGTVANPAIGRARRVGLATTGGCPYPATPVHPEASTGRVSAGSPSTGTRPGSTRPPENKNAPAALIRQDQQPERPETRGA